jgi:hypothetical protein
MMTIYKRPRVGQEVFPNNFPWDWGLLSSILFVIKISFTNIFNPQFLFINFSLLPQHIDPLV